MKIILKSGKIFIIIIYLIINSNITAQYLQNGALYDTVFGNDDTPLFWGKCETYSTPELYIEYSKHNKTYYSLDSTSFLIIRTDYARNEHLFTELITPFEKGNCYVFSGYFLYDDSVTDSQTDPVTYPVKFQIWGGNDSCFDAHDANNFELLYNSDTIKCRTWQKYTFYFDVKRNNYRYFHIRAYWDYLKVLPNDYRGVLMMDNLDLQLYTSGIITNTDPGVYYYKTYPLLQFTADEGRTYIWEPIFSVSDYNSRSIYLREYTDTLKVTVSKDNSCPVTTNYLINYNCDTVYKNFEVSEEEIYYKKDEEVILFASDGNNHKWNYEEFLINPEDNNPVINDSTLYFDSDTIIFIDTITDYYNCIYPEKFKLIKNCDTIRQRELEVEQDIYYKGEPLLFQASLGLEHHWEPPGYLSDPLVQDPLFLGYNDNYKEVITFSDSISIGFNCYQIDRFNLISNCDTIRQREFILEKDVYFKGQPIVFNASEGDSHHWEPPGYLSDDYSSSPVFSGFKDNFKPDIRFVDSIYITPQCKKVDVFNLITRCDTVYPDNEPLLKMDTLLQEISSIELNPSGTATGDWYPALGIKCLDESCTHVLVTPKSSTVYSVELEDEMNCLHSEYYKIGVVLKVPNVITPNDDQKNDEFVIQGLPGGSRLYIYDKNGFIIYSNQNYGENGWWDGKNSDGKLVETATYWYVLQIPEINDVLKGYIFVVR